MNTVILNDTLAMIDKLKTVCANYGLANDSSEYKIITEAFLYKYLNDRMLYEFTKLPEFADCDDTAAIEERFRGLDDADRDMIQQLELGTVAYVRPEWMVSSLFNRQNTDDFAQRFDEALLGIAQDNVEVYSVKAGNAAITLFQGVSRFIVEENKRNGFCAALINALSDFSFADAFSQGYDFFSQVFEYLIKDYNKDSGSYGEYFTPHAIANIMARILAPDGDKNVTVYDPAAGSGTLVLALAHQIGENNCTTYTQDRSQKANEFMRLNLILNGLVGSLENVVHDDTLVSPRHLAADGRSLQRFDYIVSNPPFKCDFSDTRDTLASEKYAQRFWAGVPKVPAKTPEKMAIYLMFIQHILYSLKPGGKAAIVVPTGFLTAKSKIELAIRTKMIESGMLRGVVSMPSNIFANTGTNVSILFVDSSKRYDHALLVDASKLGTKEKVGKNQRTVLSDDEIERIISVFNGMEEQDDFSVLADYTAIAEKRYSFSAGQYFEVKIEYENITPKQFQAEMAEHTDKLRDLWAEGERLQHEIEEQMKAVRIA
ncbi:SAM-dependent methyltransferase [Bifidobacterium primatium]|uniref:site-specific DNA-methyltransferase (adenine-specific) n=1 Tax=Bifidobacterium primatium TaxID=2045438 RepID=A0A2M9HAK7_9BIFI|nr:class I SAM-dependent DNA methyltransferase [Bifidobacterium primatium]PJM73853.1 SAM-dependent methyltransferase [Bifidobacterium primatium]